MYFSNTVAFRKNYSIELSCLSCSLICDLNWSMLFFFLRNKVLVELHVFYLYAEGMKFCLKFFTLTTVRFHNCETWQMSSLTAVKLDSCQPTPAVGRWTQGGGGWTKGRWTQGGWTKRVESIYPTLSHPGLKCWNFFIHNYPSTSTRGTGKATEVEPRWGTDVGC